MATSECATQVGNGGIEYGTTSECATQVGSGGTEYGTVVIDELKQQRGSIGLVQHARFAYVPSLCHSMCNRRS